MKKKKIFRRVIALFFAALTLLSVAIQCSAAMIATGTIIGLATIASIILVGCGVLSQTEFDALPQRDRYEMTAKYLEAHQTGAVMSVLAAKGLIGDLQEDLQKQIDVIFSDTVSSPHDKNTRERLADTFIKFASTHEDSVKKVSSGSVDLGGYGAAVHINYPNTLSGRRAWIYCDYIVVNASDISSMSSYIVYYSNGYRTVWANGDISTYSGSGSETYNVFDEVRSYGISFFGDVRYMDGSKADEVVTPDTKSANIGEVTDADGNTYPVNADGTVTVNGEDIPVNADGTVTINGDTYYPTYIISNYDDTALIDLIHQLIDTINQGQLIEETPADDVSDVPLPAVDADFESLQLSPSIATVFPFCIPWDLVRGIKLLAADPVAPRFEIPFNVPSFGEVFPGYEGTVVIDFAEYDKYFKVVRWGTFMIAMFGICFLTFKIVKGNT